MVRPKVYKEHVDEQVNSQQVFSGVNVENILRQYTEIMDFVRPDQPSRCTWKIGADKTTSPHTVVPL